MSDGAISQDEIDALLSGVAIDGLNSSGHVGNGPNYSIDISTIQKLADDLKGKLEENINKYTGAAFKVENPVAELTDRDKLLSKLPEVVISVSMDYTEGAKGSHMYLMSSDFALKVFSLVNKEETADVDDVVLSVVSELVATHTSAQINVLDATGKLPGLANGSPETSNESKAMIMFPQGDFVLTSYLNIRRNSIHIVGMSWRRCCRKDVRCFRWKCTGRTSSGIGWYGKYGSWHGRRNGCSKSNGKHDGSSNE